MRIIMLATTRIAIWQMIMTAMQTDSNGDKFGIHALTEKVEKLEHALSPWESALMIFIAITAVAALAIFLSEYGSRKIGKQLKDANAALSTAKDDALAQTLGDDKAKIEENKNETAKANERAQKLEHANLTLRGEIAILQKTAAEQQERAATAEKDLLELQERIKPRNISPDQRTKLVALLAAIPKNGSENKIGVVSLSGDAEGDTFGGQVDEVLRAAGFKTSDRGQAMYVGGHPTGFGFIVRKVATSPSYIAHIQWAFISVGIPMGIAENPELPEGYFSIMVGVKP